DASEVLLRLADVLAHDLAQVDAVEVEPELVREHLALHRLPRTARALEERADPEPATRLRREAPRVVDLRAPADVRGDLAQDLALRLRQDEVVPPRGRLDPLREVVETWARLGPACVPERAREVVVLGRRERARAGGLDPL